MTMQKKLLGKYCGWAFYRVHWVDLGYDLMPSPSKTFTAVSPLDEVLVAESLPRLQDVVKLYVETGQHPPKFSVIR
jgi:hypothetical protein